MIRAHVASDDGAARLGEIALVDRTSRVGQSGLVFYNTLFDENAASHIALGDGDPPRGPEGADDDSRGASCGRDQPFHVHTDFMIGSPEIAVSGVSADGDEMPILVGRRLGSLTAGARLHSERLAGS